MSPSTGPQISSICVSADSDELRLMLHHKFILIANTHQIPGVPQHHHANADAATQQVKTNNLKQ